MLDRRHRSCSHGNLDPENENREKRKETFNGFIRRNCPLKRLEKLPAQKMRDLYSKIQTGSHQTVICVASFVNVIKHT